PCGCKARIFIRADTINPDEVTVKYHWEHNGHMPGSVNDLRTAPLQRSLRRMVHDLVESHLDWKSIKALLRIDNAKLDAILFREYEELLQSVRVNYHVVKYAIDKAFRRRAFLAPEMKASLQKWGAKIEESRGFFVHECLDAIEEGTFTFGFMSEWQRQVMRDCGDLVCLDSTHKTCVVVLAIAAICTHWSISRMSQGKEFLYAG
ncbi:hypothetical protein BX666DRAFT_2094905, partial [Dichotomocladium elegans]